MNVGNPSVRMREKNVIINQTYAALQQNQKKIEYFHFFDSLIVVFLFQKVGPSIWVYLGLPNFKFGFEPFPRV